MAEQHVSTPQSSNDADQTGPKIPKDRQCPFCHQPFTSSSLGRHLDLYIKPKNPKPPDGIHNVEDIRRLRGNITRRQSRVSSVKEASSAPTGDASSSSAPTTSAQSKRYASITETSNNVPAPSPSPKIGDAQDRYEKMFNVKVNRPTWEATGVMNDLPPRQGSTPDTRKEASRHTLLKVDSEQRKRIADELDTGRAAELALREVLASVRDANAQQTARGLFDFDFFACSFPTLCLRLLPAPPTIHSSTPFATNESWSFNPPADQQYDALHVKIQEHGKAFLRQSQTRHQKFGPTTNVAKSLDMHKFFVHASDAYSYWNSLDPNQKQQTWQQEILRSFARAEEARKEGQNTIASLRRQIDQLSLQLDQGTKSWDGFGTTQNTPGQLPYSALASIRCSDNLMKELCRQGVDFRDWDYDRLVDKWKPVVREERKAANGLTGQRSLSETSRPRIASNPAKPQKPNGLPPKPNGLPPNPYCRPTSIATTAPPTRTNSMGSESRDEDAEGEEDDGEIDHATPSAQLHIDIHQQQHLQHNQMSQVQSPHTLHQPPNNFQSPHQTNTFHSPINQVSPNQQQMYAWSGQPGLANSGVKNIPAAPNGWTTDFNHAAMEGIEGPAGMGANQGR
ncbi:hypothetical protein E2P81_ATG05654 [Venturia nashicola]|uniref:Uncharacterized protein n=1 Tax=Venturia nashicola TaxID=86259 RepID=A0A4Z1P3V2_9PEZI|nr:hypothetical protein E6O75_ATG05794 [Venturia nashicola]TLD32678.1 hypothetical protein E2P81_ATG05654 [Venturia nashicola]